MKDPIHRYFRVGTLQWMSFPKIDPLRSLNRILTDDYFDAIELTHIADDQARDTAKRMLAQAHMTVCYGAQPCLLGPGLNVNALDEEQRQKAEDALAVALKEAKELGCEGISFLAGKWSLDTREQAYQQLLKTTRRLCDLAAPEHMMVELEVFDYDMDKAALIGPAPLAARFAADMRMTHANFGLLVDLSHIPTTHETPQFVIRALRPYITHLHFGNAVVKPGCAAYGDKHPSFGYPNSANDVPELLDYFRVLKQEGFFCPEKPMVLSMEVTPMEGEDPEIVLANTKRVVNRAWALLEE